MSELVAKYQSNDRDICEVFSSGAVHFKNSVHVSMSASNYFNGNKNFHINGYQEERKAVNEAACKGVTALNDVTYQTWRDVTPSDIKDKHAKLRAASGIDKNQKPKMTKLAEDILRLANGKRTVKQIAEMTNQSEPHIQLVMTQLEMAGLLVK